MRGSAYLQGHEGFVCEPKGSFVGTGSVRFLKRSVLFALRPVPTRSVGTWFNFQLHGLANESPCQTSF